MFIIILVSPGKLSHSQAVVTPPDSTHVIRKNDKKVDESRKQKHDKDKDKKDKKDVNQDNSPDDQQQGTNGQGGRDPVKRINSARPDMSRMRGARPPDILRPSGPLLPRGIGKPGGAFRPGGH